ncbi:MAG: hypothetical protein Kow00107_07740 [Planctomycetota bacterium]
MHEHGVYISGSDSEEQPRNSQSEEVFLSSDLRLRYDSDSIAFSLEDSSNYRYTKGWVVNIRISRY